MQLARALEVAVEGGVHQVGRVARHDVGDDGDHAAAADGHERQRDVVVARQHDEVGAARGDDLAHLVERAGRFLDADDVPAVANQALERGRLDVDRGPALDVVDEDRQRGGLGHRAEVAIEAFLRRLVVVGIHDQRGLGPGPLGLRGEIDGVRGRVGARADHDEDPARRGGDDGLDDPLVLLGRQPGVLAGRAAGQDPVGALLDVELDQLAQLRLVNLAIPERGDQRDDRTLHALAHTIVSPATRSSYVSRRRTIV